MEQYYNIAGLVVKLDSHGRTARQAEPYKCERRENADVCISAADMWEVREKLQKKYPDESEDEQEYFASCTLFYRNLLDFDGMMLHASAVVVDGKAYLFTADPGTGKSTHTGLWLRLFPDEAFILNDDKPAVRLEDGVWYAYGTPWSGKHDISVNARVPIGGIAVIEQSPANEIQPLKGIAVVHEIMKQVNRPKKEQYRRKLMVLIDKLITQVPVWKLRCNMEPEAAQLSYEAMSGKTFHGKEK